jgi:hypothetical protein
MLQSVRCRILGVCAGAALVVLFGFVPAAGAATKYMLVDSARLASLPTSGSAYTSMKRTADDAMATMSLTTPTATSPWLPDYNGKGGATLAAALMYARTGDVRYRDFVIKVNRFVIGSEDGASTKGTSNADKMLATMRQISAYVLAADLVGMDPNVTGSRPGYTTSVWKTWLGALRTKPIGAGNCSTIVNCNLRAHNWGTWASAARTTIDVYLNDAADLAVAVGRLKLWLGESMTGTPWNKTQAFDASWACIPAGLPVAFVPVNGKSCGPEKDGIIVEDAARSAHAFSTWDQPSIDYSLHAYMAQLVAAVVLDRQGYDVWNWGDRALKRVMDRLNRIGAGVATGNNWSRTSHVSWIPRHFYNTDYPTIPAQPSDTLGYTDWLYGPSAATPPPPPPPPPPALVMGTDVAGAVWTRMTSNSKRASRFSFSAPAAAAVTTIKAHVDGRGATTGSQPVRGVIYSDSSGAPNKPLATSSQVTVSANQQAQWITLSFASPVRLTAGSYWLALHSGGSSAVARYAATTVSAALRHNTGTDAYSDGASNPFGGVSTDNKRMSIFAVGTPG